MSQGVYELSLTFETMPEGLDAELAARNPLRLRINGNTLEIALKEPEAAVLALVTVGSVWVQLKLLRRRQAAEARDRRGKNE